MSNKLGSRRGLAYTGTNASQPPNIYTEERYPDIYDINYSEGDIWIYRHQVAGLDKEDVYMLVSLKGDATSHGAKAKWVLIGGSSDAEQFTADDMNVAYPINGNINLFGGTNMHTEAMMPNQDSVTVSLIADPIITGNLTVSSLGAPGVVMTVGATGLFGSSNGAEGQIIVARGAGPLWVDLVSADASVIISESIDPLHPGGINLKAAAGGGGGVTKLEGDDTLTVTPDGVTGIIKVIGDDTIKTLRSALDTLTIGMADSMAAGNIIIGGGPGVASEWGLIYSSDLSVNATYVPSGTDPLKLYPRLNLTVGGGAGEFGGLKDTLGVIAVPDIAHTVTVAGTLPIVTTTAGSTVSVGLGNPAVDGQVLISSSVGVPIWANIVGAGGITVTPGPNSIVLTGGGGGGSFGFNTIDCDSSVAVDAGAHVLYLEGAAPVGGYNNITTRGNLAQLVTIELKNAINLPLTNSGGTAGILKLGGNDFLHAYGNANTFCGSNCGSRSFGLYLANVTNNTAVGSNALTSLVSYSSSNTAIGASALTSHIGPSVGVFAKGSNVAVGAQCLASSTESDKMTCVGTYVGRNLTKTVGATMIGYNVGQALQVGGGDYLVAVGYEAGKALTTGGLDSILIGKGAGNTQTIQTNSIIIGKSSTAATNEIIIGDGSHTKTSITGIYGNTSGATNRLVTVDSAHQLEAIPTATSGKFLKSNGTAPVWSAGTATYLFLAYPQNTTNITGDNTKIYLGAEAGPLPLILVQNLGGGVYSLGSPGVGATYTIPTTATYLLNMVVRLNGLRTNIVVPLPPVPVPANLDPVVIEVSRGGLVIYEWASYPCMKFDGYTPNVTAQINVIQELVAGDVVRWYLQIDYRPGESVGGVWPLTYTNQSKTIGLDSTSGTLRFSQVGVCVLTD